MKLATNKVNTNKRFTSMSQKPFMHFWHFCRKNDLRTLFGKFLRLCDQHHPSINIIVLLINTTITMFLFQYSNDGFHHHHYHQHHHHHHHQHQVLFQREVRRANKIRAQLSRNQKREIGFHIVIIIIIIILIKFTIIIIQDWRSCSFVSWLSSSSATFLPSLSTFWRWSVIGNSIGYLLAKVFSNW